MIKEAPRVSQPWPDRFEGRPIGPFEANLRSYGDGKDKCVTGVAFGSFGGIGRNFSDLLRKFARHGAERLFHTMGASSVDDCESALLFHARRSIGFRIMATTADLILHRIQCIGGASARNLARRGFHMKQAFPDGDCAHALFAFRNASFGHDGRSDGRNVRNIRWLCSRSARSLDAPPS